VVTRPDKHDVIENAVRHKATVIAGRPDSLAASLLAGMCGLADEDVVIFGFPDSIWDPVDAYTRIIPLLDGRWEVALGLFHAEDLTRYEPVVFDESGQVLRIEFKPERPSSNRIWGCAAAQVRMLWPLEREEEPGEYFNKLCGQQAVGSVCLDGTYLDMGTREGLRAALRWKPG
jgi:hypothetical protein